MCAVNWHWGSVMRWVSIRIISLIALFISGFSAVATDIVMWHSMEASVRETLSDFVNRFNQKPEIKETNKKIVLQYKGSFEETLAAGLAALGTKNAPHILQVYEMGNLVMQAQPDAYIPLDKLSLKRSPLLQKSNFLPVMGEFYQSQMKRGTMASLPFNITTAVLFYNKDAFRKAGLDPEKPPKTWEEFEKIAHILKNQGFKYALVSRVLSGHQLDQIAAWHNVSVATKGNGIDGPFASALVMDPDFFKLHFGKLAQWYKEKIFSLDVGLQAETAFATEEAVMITQGATGIVLLPRLVKNKFDIGVGPLPYWAEKVKAPYNTIAGGTSLWALSGHTPEEYQVIQAFFEYFASPEVQAEWHERTCYIPTVVGAREIASKNNFYAKGVMGLAASIGVDSFSKNKPTTYSRGILLPNFPKIRELMIEEMKETIRGNKPVEEALYQIVKEGNLILKAEQFPVSPS